MASKDEEDVMVPDEEPETLNSKDEARPCLRATFSPVAFEFSTN